MISFVDHVEIPVPNLGKAKEFFQAIFGWPDEYFQPFGPTYMLVSSDDPKWVSLGLYEVDSISDNSSSVILTMRVEEIDTSLELIKQQGGKITREKYEVAPEIGYAANFMDPFGNTWGLHSPPN